MDVWVNRKKNSNRHAAGTVHAGAPAAAPVVIPQRVMVTSTAPMSYSKASGRVDKLVKALDGVAAEMKKYTFVSSAEMSERLLNIISIYDNDIKVVKAKKPNDSRVRDIENLREACARKTASAKTLHQKHIEDLTKGIMDDNGDEESAHLDSAVDATLSPATMQGILSIDRWLIERMHKTGLSSIWGENDKFSFVSKLLKLPARERLYMYYLVEKKKRKDAQISDVIESQLSYVPSVDIFEDQINMSGFRIFRRAAVGRVYWDKLSDAYSMMEKSRDKIRLCSSVDQNSVASKCAAKVAGAKPVEDSAEETRRDYKLQQFKQALINYKNKKVIADSAWINKQKKRTQADVAANTANIILQELVHDATATVVRNAPEADGEVSEKQQDVADVIDRVGANAGDTFSAIHDPVVEKADESLQVNSRFLGMTQANLQMLQKVNVGVLSTVALTNVISTITGIAVLSSQRSNMMTGDFLAATGELTSQLLTTLQSGFTATVKSLEAVGIIGENTAKMAATAEKAAENLEEVAGEAMSTIDKVAFGIGVGTASVALVVNGISLANVNSNSSYLKKSSQSFGNVRGNVTSSGPESEEQKKLRLRREKFEDNLIKNQERTLSEQKKTIYTSVASNGLLLGASVTGGPLSAILAGASVGVNICSTIRQSIAARRLKRQSVDEYIGINGYDGKILNDAFKFYLKDFERSGGRTNEEYYNGLDEDKKIKFKKKYMDRMRESIRNEIMSKLGCAGKTAFNNYIMEKYGEILYKGAFEKSDGSLISEAELDTAERKPYVEFIHSMGLNIKFEGGEILPSKETIVAKLQG